MPKYRNGGPGAFLSAFPIPKGARGKGAPKPASKSQEKRIATQSEPAPATTGKPKADLMAKTVADLAALNDMALSRIDAQDKAMADLAKRIGAEVGKVAAKVDSAIRDIGEVASRMDGDGDPPKRPEAPDGSVRQFVEAQVSTGTAQVHAHLNEVNATSEKRNEEILGIIREIRESL